MSRKPGSYLLPGLKRVRLDAGLSIRELAAKAEVSPDTVWRVETLRRGAEPRTRRRIARALKTSIAELRTPDREEVDAATR